MTISSKLPLYDISWDIFNLLNSYFFIRIYFWNKIHKNNCEFQLERNMFPETTNQSTVILYDYYYLKVSF